MAKIKRLPHPYSFRHRHKPRSVSARVFEQAYWPYLPLLVAISLMFSLVIRGGALSSLGHPDQRVLGYATSMNINNLLKDTNAQRVKDGLTPLKLNKSLDLAAENKAKNMASLDYWSHNTPSGQPPWVFVTAQNYSYQELGENLATGFSNESSTINAWMASAEHRANILNKDFSQIGLGVAQSSDYKAAGGGPMTIVVAFYGDPASSANLASTSLLGTASINDQSPPTKTSHAQLAFAGMSVAGAGTTVAVAIIAASLGLIIGRHLIAFRRALRRGERFVAHHPLIDLALVTVIFLAYSLTQTAGLVR